MRPEWLDEIEVRYPGRCDRADTLVKLLPSQRLAHTVNQAVDVALAGDRESARHDRHSRHGRSYGYWPRS